MNSEQSQRSDSTSAGDGPAGHAIRRSSGGMYRPRKLIAYAVTDEDESLAGVIVFGTHDPDRAQSLADGYVTWQIGLGYAAVDPCLVWWRDGFSGGRRCWLTDETSGRAGVWFRAIAEAAS